MALFGNKTTNADIIKNVYELFARGEIPALLETFDKDIIWTEMEGFPYGGTYVGAGAILNGVFMRLGSEWNNFQANPEEFLASEDRVVVLGHYRGTYKATGRGINVPFAHVWTLREDKIVKFVQYTDTLLVSKVL
jgi:ketosteroid isomerase-like protein